MLNGEVSMTMYNIEFVGYLKEWGQIDLEADDVEQAEGFALEQIKDLYPEYEDIEVESIKEIS
jgi:predicted nuclease of restriction endonuclease-like (RecB) superfamily